MAMIWPTTPGKGSTGADRAARRRRRGRASRSRSRTAASPSWLATRAAASDGVQRSSDCSSAAGISSRRASIQARGSVTLVQRPLTRRRAHRRRGDRSPRPWRSRPRPARATADHGWAARMADGTVALPLQRQARLPGAVRSRAGGQQSWTPSCCGRCRSRSGATWSAPGTSRGRSRPRASSTSGRSAWMARSSTCRRAP